MSKNRQKKTLKLSRNRLKMSKKRWKKTLKMSKNRQEMVKNKLKMSKNKLKKTLKSHVKSHILLIILYIVCIMTIIEGFYTRNKQILMIKIKNNSLKLKMDNYTDTTQINLQDYRQIRCQMGSIHCVYQVLISIYKENMLLCYKSVLVIKIHSNGSLYSDYFLVNK